MDRNELFERAREVMPGGANSSTRMNRALGTPFFASRASGSRIWDVEGRELIDMCCAHGAALLGHDHPAVRGALAQALAMGFPSAAETEYHEKLARMVCSLVPCAEKVRFCSSGSEATLHMIRGCRGFTGRDKILRVEGHFHGYHELIYIGGQPPRERFAGNREHPVIESPGIPDSFAQHIVVIPFNDPEALEQAMRTHDGEIATLILEPVNYNSGCILPDPGYLELARELCTRHGVVLFFDEIQSSFKKSPGGAQQDFGVVPDVCTMGKSLGGGLPLSAFGGRADIMDVFQPVGGVQHSGTFNAHIIPVLAGLAFLGEVTSPTFYPTLRALEQRFHRGMDEIIDRHGLTMVVPHHGARFDILLGTSVPARRYEDTFCHDRKLMLRLVRECHEKGVYFHDYGGSPVHHGYSVQHTPGDIDTVLSVLDEVLGGMREELRE